MQDIQVRDEGHYETLDQVVRMYITGQKNATQIAKELRIPRKDVLNYIDEWREIAKNTDMIKDRATQALHEMDLHYDMIIKSMWEIANDDTVNERTRAQVLKNIADVEAKRQETLQKAGLYDDAGLTDELVELQEKVDNITHLLLTVAGVFPQTKQYIAERLALLQEGVVEVPNTVKGETV